MRMTNSLFHLPRKGGDEESVRADSDKGQGEDGKEEEQDPSPLPEVGRKKFEDGGVEGKRTADKDVNRARYEIKRGEYHHRSQ